MALRPLALEPLPLGSIKPGGWLKNQLRIQADGLSGHLDEFWPDVADSAWVGGEAEGWERGPYWLDGMVPLAYLLGDAGLEHKTASWIDHMLEQRHADGWLGPVVDETYGYRHDPWPLFVVLKAFTQYCEVTGDARIVPAMQNLARQWHRLLDQGPLKKWAAYRWGDAALSLYWLFERTGDGNLLDLARKFHDRGFDWQRHFDRFPYRERVTRDDSNLASHVVNNAMAVKYPAIWYRLSGKTADRDASCSMIATLDTYHGQVTGLFSGDEHLAGRNPSQGTELCAVVEYMFSLENLVAITGDAAFADRLESIAFNALPATFKPDMWAHQYDQQANQVICRVAEDRIYTTNGPDSNIFGLEPNYGCCTANMHQGWPKLASHLWMRTAGSEGSGEGLAAVSYCPCRATTQINGARVQIDVDTDYPFSESIAIRISSDRAVRFPLSLRIPAWTRNAVLEIEGHRQALPSAPGFHAVNRTWEGEVKAVLTLPMPVAAERRYNDSVAIKRGPLIYSLKIEEQWQRINTNETGRELPHGDWEVAPASPWNYGLCLDTARPAASIRFEESAVGSMPFSPGGAPVTASVVGRTLPGWGLAHNAAGPIPHPVGPPEGLNRTLTLIPYGCTNLRVTEFPLIRGSG